MALKIILDVVFERLYSHASRPTLRGVAGTLVSAGRDVAPAGGRKTFPHALGRPWVTVRPHYGGLPLMLAGRGIGERRETVGISGLRRSAPLPGRTVPGTEIATMERRKAFPRPLLSGDPDTTRCGTVPKSRLSALHLPHLSRETTGTATHALRRGQGRRTLVPHLHHSNQQRHHGRSHAPWSQASWSHASAPHIDKFHAAAARR